MALRRETNAERVRRLTEKAVEAEKKGENPVVAVKEAVQKEEAEIAKGKKVRVEQETGITYLVEQKPGAKDYLPDRTTSFKTLRKTPEMQEKERRLAEAQAKVQRGEQLTPRDLVAKGGQTLRYTDVQNIQDLGYRSETNRYDKEVAAMVEARQARRDAKAQEKKTEMTQKMINASQYASYEKKTLFTAEKPEVLAQRQQLPGDFAERTRNVGEVTELVSNVQMATDKTLRYNPLLGGDNYAQRFFRSALSLPVTISGGLIITGAATANVAEGLFRPDTRATVSKTLGESVVPGTISTIKSFDPRQPEGAVNLLLVGSPLLVRSIRAVAPKTEILTVESKSVTVPGEASAIRVTKSRLKTGNKEFAAETYEVSKPDIPGQSIVTQNSIVRNPKGAVVGVERSVIRTYDTGTSSVGIGDTVTRTNVNTILGQRSQTVQSRSQITSQELVQGTRTQTGIIASEIKPTSERAVTQPQDVGQLQFKENPQVVSRTAQYGIEQDIVSRPFEFKTNIEGVEIGTVRQTLFSESVAQTRSGKSVQKLIKEQGYAIEDLKISSTTDIAIRPAPSVETSAGLKSIQTTSPLFSQQNIVSQLTKPQPVTATLPKIETKQEAVTEKVRVVTSAPTTMQATTQRTTFQTLFVPQETQKVRSEVSAVPKLQQTSNLAVLQAGSTRRDVAAQVKMTPTQRQRQSYEVAIKPVQITNTKILAEVAPVQTVRASNIAKVVPQQKRPVIFGKLKTETVRSPMASRQGFNVFVRRQGKFQKVNTGSLSYTEAKAFGANVVQNTAAATFKVTPGGAVSGSYSGFGSFADFYKKGEQFIQKRSKRIGTVGEKREITYKGIAARRGSKFGTVFK